MRLKDRQKAPCEAALSDAVRTRQEGSHVASELRLGSHRGHQVSEMWTQATEMEKGPYEALSQIDRVRHQSEVEAYNYRCPLPPTHAPRWHPRACLVCLQTPHACAGRSVVSTGTGLHSIWSGQYIRLVVGQTSQWGWYTVT